MLEYICYATFIVIYVLPILIAFFRKSRAGMGILLLTAFCGWTVVGWAAAFAWSLVGETNDDKELDKWKKP